MRTLWLTSVLFICATLAYAEDDCPAAVDAADAQNPNAFKNCDYSDKGLNGALHRAWAKKSESATTDDKTESAKAPEAKNEMLKDEVSRGVAQDISQQGEFSNAQQLQNLRFNLLQKAAQACAKGFSVVSETYTPTASKTLKLELNYRCL